MKSSNSHQDRRKIFVWVLLGCVALAVGYTARGVLRAGAEPIQGPEQGDPLAIAGPEELKAIQSASHLVYLRQEQTPYGQVNLAALDPASSLSAPIEKFSSSM